MALAGPPWVSRQARDLAQRPRHPPGEPDRRRSSHVRQDEAIRDPAAIPGYHVDYREKLSLDPSVRWTDRLTIDGTWVGNLFQFYQKVIQRLTVDIKLPFQLGPDLFRRDETLVHEAIREALVNALIHADYRGQGGVVVEKYRNRIELSNPGSLLLSLEQVWSGGVSECRNKSLQTMFLMIGGGEKAGSGIDKIRQGWRAQHWRLPISREQVQPDRVNAVLPMVSHCRRIRSSAFDPGSARSSTVSTGSKCRPWSRQTSKGTSRIVASRKSATNTPLT